MYQSKNRRSALRKGLLEAGIPERRLPAPFKDKVVKRTRRDKVGQLAIREFSGVQDNAASRTIRRFEENVGGREDIVEKLSAAPKQTEATKRLLAVLKGNPNKRKSLARFMAEVDMAPGEIMTQYAQGCIALAKVESAIEAHRNLPGVVKDLVRHAIDQEVLCGNCLGTGTQRARSHENQESQPCVLCQGSGLDYRVSDHKEFAAKQLLEITQAIQKSPATQVNVQQNVSVTGKGGSFMEKMMGTSDEVLYGRVKKGKKESRDVIDAEFEEEKQDE